MGHNLGNRPDFQAVVSNPLLHGFSEAVTTKHALHRFPQSVQLHHIQNIDLICAVLYIYL